MLPFIRVLIRSTTQKLSWQECTNGRDIPNHKKICIASKMWQGRIMLSEPWYLCVYLCICLPLCLLTIPVGRVWGINNCDPTTHHRQELLPITSEAGMTGRREVSIQYILQAWITSPASELPPSVREFPHQYVMRCYPIIKELEDQLKTKNSAWAKHTFCHVCCVRRACNACGTTLPPRNAR